MKEIMMESGKTWCRPECGGSGRWMEDPGGLEDLETGAEGCMDLRAKMGSVQTQRADRKDETSCQETWAGARLACGHQ